MAAEQGSGEGNGGTSGEGDRFRREQREQGRLEIGGASGESVAGAGFGRLVSLPGACAAAVKDSVEGGAAVHGGGVLRGAGGSGDVLPITEEKTTHNRKRAMTENFSTSGAVDRVGWPPMRGQDIDERLRRLGKDRRWLAEQTGYEWVSLRDCLAPGSKKGVSSRMAEKIGATLAEAEAQLPEGPGNLLDQLTAAERDAIGERARKEGFGGSHYAWIVSTIRWVLTKPRGPRK